MVKLDMNNLHDRNDSSGLHLLNIYIRPAMANAQADSRPLEPIFLCGHFEMLLPIDLNISQSWFCKH